MNIPADLLPLDVLLCYGWEATQKVTDSDTGHVAVYIGDGVVVTSLTATGVNYYDIGQGAQNIVKVLRARPGYSPLADGVVAGKRIFEQKYRSLPYGWDDCERSEGIHADGTGMDCSHTGVQFLEDCGLVLLNPQFDKRKFRPDHFEMYYPLETIWVSPEPAPKPDPYTAVAS